jgi:hypothetical protein
MEVWAGPITWKLGIWKEPSNMPPGLGGMWQSSPDDDLE